MTYEERIICFLDLVYKDYAAILGMDGAGIFIFWVWYDNNVSKKTGIKGRVSGLPGVSNYNPEDVLKIIKKLRACGLISVKKSEDGDKVIQIDILEPKRPSYEFKISVLESLMKSKIINQSEKDNILTIFKILKNQDQATEIVGGLEGTMEIEFSNQALVEYYYELMSKVFGGNHVSPNVKMEAKIIGKVRDLNKDSSDDTRKFMMFILNAAKEKNAFQWVSTLSSYDKQRRAAYQKLIVEQNNKYDKFMKYENLQQKQKSAQQGMEEIYNFCIENGISERTKIETKLKEVFASEIIDKYLSEKK